MGIRPAVRHFIACKKEPIVVGREITLNDVFLYAIRPKPPFQYPVWHRSFYLFAIVVNGLGLCSFAVQMRLVELNREGGKEEETLVGESKSESFDAGTDRQRVWPLSIMMPPVLLPQPGIYRLYLLCDGEAIACEEIHAR